jgi:hypothetical protein
MIDDNTDFSSISGMTEKPHYICYSDVEIETAINKHGKLEKKLRERLIRGTINNMVSAASSAPFNRFPERGELEAMARMLIRKYPCLNDEETGHVSNNL